MTDRVRAAPASSGLATPRDVPDLLPHELEAIELGLRWSADRVAEESGILERLAVDSLGSPVVVVQAAPGVADEVALVQALGYSGWIEANPDAFRHLIRRSGVKRTDPGALRLLVVAASFAPRTISAARASRADVKLVLSTGVGHPVVGIEQRLFTTILDGAVRPETFEPAPDPRVADHFQGPHQPMQPLYERLIERIRSDVGPIDEIRPTEKYVGLWRRNLFAAVYVAPKEIDVELRLASAPKNLRLHPELGWDWRGRGSFWFAVRRPEDLDGDALAWIRESYLDS